MREGIFYIVCACMCWALVFVLPSFISDFSAIEIVIGRCLFFGLLSLSILFLAKRHLFFAQKKIWLMGAFIALIGFVIHYCSLVLSLRYINPAIPTLILGLTPVCISIHYAMKSKEKLNLEQTFSCILILTGLFFINSPYLTLESNSSFINYLWGIFWSLLALATWIAFITGSAAYIKNNPSTTTSDWITVMGVSTLFWGILASIIIFSPALLAYPTDKFTIWTESLLAFLVVTAILGLISSWLGSYMWNQSTKHLSINLAGQLSILEAVFGLIFVQIAAWKLPLFIEVIGIIAILGGIYLNLNTIGKKSSLIELSQ